MSLRFRALAIASTACLALAAESASAQANPSAQDANNARNNPCTDPWISLAVSVAKTTGAGPGRAAGSGSSDECAPALYNGGQWSSYAQLLQAVRATINGMASQNVRFAMQGGVPALLVIDPSRAVAGQAAKIVTNASSNIVAQGGGNIVAQGGGNIVAQGGGNYTVLSAGEKLRIALPGGKMLVIRR